MRTDNTIDIPEIRATREYIDNLCQQAILLSPEQVARLEAAVETYAAAGWLIDPTTYRSSMKMQEKRQTVIAAFARFHAVLWKILEQEKAAAEAASERAAARLRSEARR